MIKTLFVCLPSVCHLWENVNLLNSFVYGAIVLYLLLLLNFVLYRSWIQHFICSILWKYFFIQSEPISLDLEFPLLYRRFFIFIFLSLHYKDFSTVSFLERSVNVFFIMFSSLISRSLMHLFLWVVQGTCQFLWFYV